MAISIVPLVKVAGFFMMLLVCTMETMHVYVMQLHQQYVLIDVLIGY